MGTSLHAATRFHCRWRGAAAYGVATDDMKKEAEQLASNLVPGAPVACHVGPCSELEAAGKKTPKPMLHRLILAPAQLILSCKSDVRDPITAMAQSCGQNDESSVFWRQTLREACCTSFRVVTANHIQL